MRCPGRRRHQHQAWQHISLADPLDGRREEVPDEDEIGTLLVGHAEFAGLHADQGDAGSTDSLVRAHEAAGLRDLVRRRALHLVEQLLNVGLQEAPDLADDRLTVGIGHADLALLVDDDGDIEEIAVEGHVAEIAVDPVAVPQPIDILRGIIPGGIVVQRCAELVLEGLDRADQRLARAFLIEMVGIGRHTVKCGENSEGNENGNRGKHQQQRTDGKTTISDRLEPSL